MPASGHLYQGVLPTDHSATGTAEEVIDTKLGIGLAKGPIPTFRQTLNEQTRENTKCLNHLLQH